MIWLSVALGGAAGSLLRAGIQRWQPLMNWPLSTLLINVLGCFLLGLLWAFLGERAGQGLTWNALGVGLLGGFTTYSAYSLDILRMLDAGRVLPALSYALLTLTLALLACALGLLLGRLLRGG